jgi:hypothetical protein
VGSKKSSYLVIRRQKDAPPPPPGDGLWDWAPNEWELVPTSLTFTFEDDTDPRLIMGLHRWSRRALASTTVLDTGATAAPLQTIGGLRAHAPLPGATYHCDVIGMICSYSTGTLQIWDGTGMRSNTTILSTIPPPNKIVDGLRDAVRHAREGPSWRALAEAVDPRLPLNWEPPARDDLERALRLMGLKLQVTIEAPLRHGLLKLSLEPGMWVRLKHVVARTTVEEGANVTRFSMAPTSAVNPLPTFAYDVSHAAATFLSIVYSTQRGTDLGFFTKTAGRH